MRTGKEKRKINRKKAVKNVGKKGEMGGRKAGRQGVKVHLSLRVYSSTMLLFLLSTHPYSSLALHQYSLESSNTITLCPLTSERSPFSNPV